MEDRKFADIGSVAALQYAEGPFHIAEWSPLVTVHVIAGAASVSALAPAAKKHGNGTTTVMKTKSDDDAHD